MGLSGLEKLAASAPQAQMGGEVKASFDCSVDQVEAVEDAAKRIKDGLAVVKAPKDYYTEDGQFQCRTSRQGQLEIWNSADADKVYVIDPRSRIHREDKPDQLDPKLRAALFTNGSYESRLFAQDPAKGFGKKLASKKFAKLRCDTVSLRPLENPSDSLASLYRLYCLHDKRDGDVNQQPVCYEEYSSVKQCSRDVSVRDHFDVLDHFALASTPRVIFDAQANQDVLNFDDPHYAYGQFVRAVAFDGEVSLPSVGEDQGTNQDQKPYEWALDLLASQKGKKIIDALVGKQNRTVEQVARMKELRTEIADLSEKIEKVAEDYSPKLQEIQTPLQEAQESFKAKELLLDEKEALRDEKNRQVAKAKGRKKRKLNKEIKKLENKEIPQIERDRDRFEATVGQLQDQLDAILAEAAYQKHIEEIDKRDGKQSELRGLEESVAAHEPGDFAKAQLGFVRSQIQTHFPYLQEALDPQADFSDESLAAQHTSAMTAAYLLLTYVKSGIPNIVDEPEDQNEATWELAKESEDPNELQQDPQMFARTNNAAVLELFATEFRALPLSVSLTQPETASVDQNQLTKKIRDGYLGVALAHYSETYIIEHDRGLSALAWAGIVTGGLLLLGGAAFGAVKLTEEPARNGGGGGDGEEDGTMIPPVPAAVDSEEGVIGGGRRRQ